MFEEADNLDHPYFASKHEAEKIVRARMRRCPWRIYRPGLVVGDSRTGEMDKIDGPYYFFKLIQKMRENAAALGADDRLRGRAASIWCRSISSSPRSFISPISTGSTGAVSI